MIRSATPLASLGEAITGARFVARLPAFLRQPITVDEARTILRQRLEHRETDFLEIARQAIYDRPESPYRQILQLAGCEYGDLVRLEHLGWTTHLHAIRSYEKITAVGMTLLDRDLIRVIEEVLPARFGGAPTDYQLIEHEADDGSPRVALLVHPQVGPLPSEAVTEAFLTAIAGGSGAERIMSMVWRDAGLLRVERRPPVATATGKILHVRPVSSERATSPAREDPDDGQE